MLYRQVPPLPGLTPNGRRVVVMRGVDASNVIPSVADGMKVVLMIGDIRLKEELVGVAGDVYVLDASIATPQHFASHFSKFTPTLIKKFLICVQASRELNKISCWNKLAILQRLDLTHCFSCTQCVVYARCVKFFSWWEPGWLILVQVTNAQSLDTVIQVNFTFHFSVYFIVLISDQSQKYVCLRLKERQRQGTSTLLPSESLYWHTG